MTELTVTQDCVVQLHYRLREADKELETTYSDGPILYLHGHNNMLPALEKALEGGEQGQEMTVTLEAHEAYGERKERPPRRVPLKHLHQKKKPKVGDIVSIATEQGSVDATVVKVGLKNVDVDTNHPYAGKQLTFEVTIVSIRQATESELTHGHAHGIGGHNH